MAKGIATRCRQQFDSTNWQRGAQYYARGCVKIGIIAPDSLEATVQGSDDDPYSVLIDWSEADTDTLLVDCTCPRYADMNVCKHLAAVIRAMDVRGLSRLIPGSGNLYLESDGLARADDDARSDFPASTYRSTPQTTKKSIRE